MACFFSCVGLLKKNTTIFFTTCAVGCTGTECSDFSVGAGMMLKHLKEEHYKIKYAINASRKKNADSDQELMLWWGDFIKLMCDMSEVMEQWHEMEWGKDASMFIV